MRTRSRKVFFIVLLASLSGSAAYAQNLGSPFSLDTADTLPRNVRNPRFINIFGQISERFAGDGQSEGLGAQLNKLVLWSDVIRDQDDNDLRALLRGALRANDIDENGSPGLTAGEVNTYANVKVAALAWGLSDSFTIAGVLPIVKVEVNASLGFIAPGSDYGKLVAGMDDSSSRVKAYDIQSKFDHAINRKLERLGYETIPASQTISGIGDFQLVSKYRLYNDGINGVALKGTVIFPTGTPPNADKALDIPTGTGRFGTAFGAVYDRRYESGTRWTNAATYTAMLPRHEMRRIPLSVKDMLSADKEEMYEHFRHQFAFTTGADQRIDPIGLTFGAGYAMQFLSRADYEYGTSFEEGRYYLLEDARPMQSLHSLIMTSSFSTVDWYRQKKFKVPFQVNVSYAHPLAGRNVPAGGLLTGELVAFF